MEVKWKSPNLRDLVWTPELEEFIIGAKRDGLSGSQTAAKIDRRVTKNAVIAKLWRMRKKKREQADA